MSEPVINVSELTRGGAGPYTFVITSGALPPGLVLDSATGATGTPTVPGLFSFTIQSTDINGCFGSNPYSIAIGAPSGGPTLNIFGWRFSWFSPAPDCSS